MTNPVEIEPPFEQSEYAKQVNLKEVQDLDFEILDHSETTRQLVELGITHINHVTERYGTTARPKWVSGSYEQDVIMSYHNGGSDGHSSVGSRGAGVPRNVLIIAKAVNATAGKEVYSPLARAIAFNAAAAHDIVQLCGRSLLEEGQIDETRGDERLSAEYARDSYLQIGGDTEIAQRIYKAVMSTAFNPNLGSQNIADRESYANETDFIQGSLDQELVAAADLFGPTTSRGPLGAFEYCIEWLSSHQKDQIIQERLAARGFSSTDIPTMQAMLEFIDSDNVLRGALGDTMTGQAKFFKEFISYSDKTIKMVSGKGIDELFPGRMENGDIMQGFSDDLQAGRSAVDIWQSARHMNGEVYQ